MNLETGTLINQYRIISAIGKGGMGEVFLAQDTKLDRKVAIKFLNEECSKESDKLNRFIQEAKAVSALNHPNILTVYEIGEKDETNFIVTEFIEGKTLRQQLSPNQPYSLGQVLKIGIQVAEALIAAHQAGIIHRDIKPENIMIRQDGYAKVLDFGLAKLSEQKPENEPVGLEDETRGLVKTTPGMVLGTFAYMSPEQTRGKATDARTDIWSLGVVLYEMLSGCNPFSRETRMDIIAAVLSSEPPPISSYGLDIPAELDWIVSKALAKDVETRYQSAKEMRADLEKIAKRMELNESFRRMINTDSGKGLTEAVKVESTFASGIKSVFEHADKNRFGYLILVPIFLGVIFSVGYLLYGFLKEDRRIDSIAVLPLQNSSADLNFVSDGLSEALIDRLSQLPQLKVIARSSSFAFRGENQNVRDIAQKLGVRAIVTGSVTQAGDDLMIRVDVVDAIENMQLTGGSFRRKAGDLLGIQSEIARLTAEKLQLKLTDSQTKRLSGNETENSEAYRVYLNGLMLQNGPLETKSRALEYFEEAVKLDPNFAAAQTEAAWEYWVRANSNDDPHSMMPKIKAATERALEIDPEYAKAHVLKAVLAEFDFDWQGAEKEYRRAIELSPNLNFARNNHAYFLSIMNRQEEALAEIGQQSLRDPLNQWMALLNRAIILVQARRFDEALEAHRQAQAIEPTKKVPDFALGYAHAGKGLSKEAIDYYERSVEFLGGKEKYSQPLVYLVAEYAKVPERRDEARTILKRIEAMDEYKSPALLAAVYVALDENDKAMELLEKAYQERDLLLRFIGVAYEYDGLRNEPRFKELLRKMNLPG